MHLLILLNGALPTADRLKVEVSRAQAVIAADGAADRALATGVVPDFVVGDLDSISLQARQQLADRLVPQPDQDHTDGHKALVFALKQGATSLSVCGAGGGRLDHQLSNLSTLSRFAKRVEIQVVDPAGTGYFLRGRRRLQTVPGQQLSLIAFGRVQGVWTRGLKYPLQGGALAWAGPSGQSNQATGKAVHIRIGRGTLFVFCVLATSPAGE